MPLFLNQSPAPAPPLEVLFPPKADLNPDNTVSARAVWQFLEPPSLFAPWFALRVKELGLVRDLDYVFVPVSKERNQHGGSAHDYALTLDAAKELAMVEPSEAGHRARRYFLDSEKKLRQAAQNSSSVAFRDALRRRIRQLEEDERLNPVAQAAENVF
jgi:phage anti-repressor protein